jgi:hypothetical protein
MAEGPVDATQTNLGLIGSNLDMLPAPTNPKYQNTVSPKDTPHKIRFLPSQEQKKKQKFNKIKIK